jgi:ribosomal protein L35
MKSNKSFSRRIKVTKTGKLLCRPKGQCHFNSKDSSKKRMSKRGTEEISLNTKIKRRFLPGVSK